MLLPNSSGDATRMTLYRAFFTTDIDSPAEMLPTLAPSFCACLTEEFMNTVHLEPRSTGAGARSPSFEKSSMEYPSALANA